ncbi:hypothetical protein ONZ45_g392 [Pleurotus djamor]|nr:hypothetical protein ONZ45_g392 [Pleurotus djamor]
MHRQLPLELVLLAVKSVDPEETPTLLNLLLVSRQVHSIAEPCLYESIRFNWQASQKSNQLAGKIQCFLESITKNDGARGAHVQKFVVNFSPFGGTSNYWDMIAQILPTLTRLTHFEVSQACNPPDVVAESIFSAFCTSQLSTFIWEGEFMGEQLHLREFLQTHQSIQHLEIPPFTFSPPLSPTVLLPCLKKLVARRYHDLLDHPALRMVTHLGLSVPDDLPIARADVEASFPCVQYFAALEDFGPDHVVKFSSRLPNLRGLVYSPDMPIHLEEFRDQIEAHPFPTKKLEYLALSCTADDEDSAEPVIREVFEAIPSLRVVDFFDYELGGKEYTRYFADGPSSTLSLSKHPKYWPTEAELSRMLTHHAHA